MILGTRHDPCLDAERLDGVSVGGGCMAHNVMFEAWWQFRTSIVQDLGPAVGHAGTSFSCLMVARRVSAEVIDNLLRLLCLSCDVIAILPS